MKKLCFILLIMFLIIGCTSDPVITTKDIENNIKPCIVNLKNDIYIKACDDIKTETQVYLSLIKEYDQEIDVDIFQQYVTDLLVINDITNNQGLKDAVFDLYNDIIKLVEPELLDIELINYTTVANSEPFIDLADIIRSKANLQYQNTLRKRLDYNDDEVIFKTTFIDDNMIVVDYYTDEEANVQSVQISSQNNDQNIYLNFARVYTELILMNHPDIQNYIANHDGILVERKLQFPNDDEFLNTNFEISVIDQRVIIKPLD